LRAMFALQCVVLFAAFVAVAVPARGEDWPQFRGPTGQGLATSPNPPLTWSTKKNVAWTRLIPGKGWSSPVVVKGRVYLTTAVGPEEAGGSMLSLRVLCLEESNGSTIWEKSLFEHDAAKAPHGHMKNSQA